MSPASETTRTGALLRGIRRMPLFQQCVPMESGMGWMLPWRKDGRVFGTVPFFGMPPSREGGGVPLFPPFATLTLEWANARVVGFRNLAVDGLWPEAREPVGRFPHAAVAQLRRSEYLALRAELFAHYDALCQMLASGGALDPAWSARFSELLRQLMEPALEPYYRQLAPNFVGRFLGTD
jgi:hypothetical protein